MQKTPTVNLIERLYPCRRSSSEFMILRTLLITHGVPTTARFRNPCFTARSSVERTGVCEYLLPAASRISSAVAAITGTPAHVNRSTPAVSTPSISPSESAAVSMDVTAPPDCVYGSGMPRAAYMPLNPPMDG